MMYILLLAILTTVSLSATDQQYLQLKNKAYVLELEEKEIAKPILGAFVGGMLGYGTGKSFKRLVSATDNKTLDKMLVLAHAGLTVSSSAFCYSYASTISNKKVWPIQAIKNVQDMVNDFAVLKSLHVQGIQLAQFDANSSNVLCSVVTLCSHYLKSIDRALEQLQIHCFELCDEHLLAVFEALEYDVNALKSGKVLEFSYEKLIEASCDNALFCIQLDLLRSHQKSLTNILHTMQYHCMQSLRTQEQAFDEAIMHAQRLVNINYSCDLIQAMLWYAKFSAECWWSGQE